MEETQIYTQVGCELDEMHYEIVYNFVRYLGVDFVLGFCYNTNHRHERCKTKALAAHEPWKRHSEKLEEKKLEQSDSEMS